MVVVITVLLTVYVVTETVKLVMTKCVSVCYKSEGLCKVINL